MKKIKALMLATSLFCWEAHAKSLDSITAPKPSSDIPGKSGSSSLDGKLRLSTSFGPASLTIDSANYKVGGASEILVEYKIGDVFLGSNGFWTSFKYMPLGANADVEGVEYTGVMDGIFFGVGLDYGLPMIDWSAFVSAELGGFLPDLESTVEVDGVEEPTDFASGLLISGGANYHITDKFIFGPKLTVGSGTFTAWHLALNGTFSF
jgi:hypothetical protein